MPAKPTTALLIHGFLDRGASWDDFAKALTHAGLGVLSPDLAGAGERTQDAGPFTLERAAAEMIELLDERPGEIFVIVGHSMGGQIADLIANQRPDRIAALILITAVPLSGRDMPEEARQLLRGAGGDPKVQRHIREQFSSNLTSAQIDGLVEQPGLMGRATAESYYDAFTAGHATGQDHSTFTGPVLVVAAANDQVVTVEQSRLLKSERYPHADFKVVEHSGHWVHSEQPEAAAMTVLDFIRKSC